MGIDASRVGAHRCSGCGDEHSARPLLPPTPARPDPPTRSYECNWDEEEARKNILRTHTTAISSRCVRALATSLPFARIVLENARRLALTFSRSPPHARAPCHCSTHMREARSVWLPAKPFQNSTVAWGERAFVDTWYTSICHRGTCTFNTITVRASRTACTAHELSTNEEAAPIEDCTCAACAIVPPQSCPRVMLQHAVARGARDEGAGRVQAAQVLLRRPRVPQ